MKNIAIFIAALAVMIAACKHKPEATFGPASPAELICKLSECASDGFSESTTFQYDDQHRILQLDLPRVYHAAYRYAADSIEMIRTDESGALLDRAILLVNQDGYPTKIWTQSHYPYQTFDTYGTYTFAYDQEGYLVSENAVTTSDQETILQNSMYEVGNGNYTRQVRTIQVGNLPAYTIESKYIYDTTLPDKLDMRQLIFSPYSLYKIPFGKGNKNLILGENTLRDGQWYSDQLLCYSMDADSFPVGVHCGVDIGWSLRYNCE